MRVIDCNDAVIGGLNDLSQKPVDAVLVKAPRTQKIRGRALPCRNRCPQGLVRWIDIDIDAIQNLRGVVQHRPLVD